VSVRQQATLLGVLHLSERLRRLRDVFPSLSRACLGKMIMLMYKWGKKTIFMYEWLRRRLIAWVMICQTGLGNTYSNLMAPGAEAVRLGYVLCKGFTQRKTTQRIHANESHAR
jgi:hypothetical protein